MDLPQHGDPAPPAQGEQSVADAQQLPFTQQRRVDAAQPHRWLGHRELPGWRLPAEDSRNSWLKRVPGARSPNIPNRCW
jgi:hypothetical protein